MTKMRQWSIVTVIAVIVVFAAGWFLLVKPQKSKVTSLKSQASSQNEQNQLLLSQISTLQAEQKQLPAQELALQKFSTEVPDNAAEPTLIRQLSAAAAGAGVDLLNMTPGTATALASASATPGSTSLSPSASSGGLLELPVSVSVTGSYPDVESFFQSLEKLPRALLVSQWSMCPLSTSASSASSGGGCSATAPPANKTPPIGTLGATLSANVFYAPPAGTVSSATTGATTTGTTTTGTATPAPSATPSAAASTAPTN
jgi:type IV pilus assembly protein PilO